MAANAHLTSRALLLESPDLKAGVTQVLEITRTIETALQGDEFSAVARLSNERDHLVRSVAQQASDQALSVDIQSEILQILDEDTQALLAMATTLRESAMNSSSKNKANRTAMAAYRSNASEADR